jgi:hypothetical protein
MAQREKRLRIAVTRISHPCLAGPALGQNQTI